MGEIIDKVASEHLDAVKLASHVVEASLKYAKVGKTVEIFFYMYLEIALCNIARRAYHVADGAQKYFVNYTCKDSAYQRT